MNGEIAELRQLFIDAGWQDGCHKLSDDSSELHGLFSASFAVFAFAYSESSDSIVPNWSSMQGELAELRSKGILDKSKDIYLLFIVEAVEEDTLGELQSILDDTRVCRKICLERRGRSLSETLDDVPFFLTPGVPAIDERQTSPAIETFVELPINVQEALEKRSDRAILDALLAGEFDVDE